MIDEDDAGHHRAHEQAVDAVLGDDARDHDDERAGRSADLHVRSAERRDDEAGDDRAVDAGLRRHARRDGEGHRQRQRDQADRHAGDQIRDEQLWSVVTERENRRGKKPAASRHVYGAMEYGGALFYLAFTAAWVTGLRGIGSDLRIQIQLDPRYAPFADRASELDVLGERLPARLLRTSCPEKCGRPWTLNAERASGRRISPTSRASSKSSRRSARWCRKRILDRLL